MTQLGRHKDAGDGVGPWYVERKNVVAFRTHKNSECIEVLLRGGSQIFVDNSPENMDFLLSPNKGSRHL